MTLEIWFIVGLKQCLNPELFQCRDFVVRQIGKISC